MKGTGGLLCLREEFSNGDAELGTGFQYPNTRDPERKVLLVSPVNKPVEDRVVEYPPPVTVLCRVGLHTLVICVQPGL